MRKVTSTSTKSSRKASAPTVGQLMSPALYTVRRDQTLEEAHRLMRLHDVRHLPVVDEGRLVGLLSQRDLYFVETIAGVDPTTDVVADAMETEVFTVPPSCPLRDAARTMAEEKHGCAVVVDRGEAVGVFTTHDALLHLANALPTGDRA